jgi:SAM-dependent methyltransferase
MGRALSPGTALAARLTRRSPAGSVRGVTPCHHPPREARPLFDARDPVTGDAFAVAECGACGLAVTVPPPSPEALRRYYPAAYHRAAGARRFLAAVEWAQGKLYARRARAVERLAGGPGRVLDVGCGPGALLQAFATRGWQIHGTELDDGAAAAARAAGAEVHAGPLETAPWPDGHFDAIVSWHSLEHFPEPSTPLAHARRLLRPGGALLVAVPNFGSPEARLARGAWFHLDVPRHLTHFTPAALRRALAGAGFEAVSESHLALEYDTFSLVQSALNRLGLRQNALYDLLRTRGSRLGAPGARGAAVASLLLAAPLGLLALPASLALAGAGRGATLTVRARRTR